MTPEVEDVVEMDEDQDERTRTRIRRGYKQLMEEVTRNEERLVRPTEDNKELLGYLREGDLLFSQVKGPQECVMDASMVRNLSRICKEQVHHMSANVNTFRCEEYAERLRNSMNVNKTGLDKRRWLQLGQQAKSLFRRSPGLTFMFGALPSEPQPRLEKTREVKARQATKFSELRETEAEALQETETTDNMTDRIVQKILRRLVERFRENGRKPINYFQFVLHPTDFGASVENMFHVSFLIKENRAGISICPDSGLPLIQPIAAKKNLAQRESTEEVARSQVVMNWSVESWRKLVKDLRIQTAMID